MSAGFFFLRSSRGADADEGAAAAAPAGFRLAPAPLAKDAKGFRPGPPRVVMGPRERGLKEMESADIVWNGGGTTTDGSRRKDRKNDRRLGAFSSSISLTLFFSCEEQKETERERESNSSLATLCSRSQPLPPNARSTPSTACAPSSSNTKMRQAAPKATPPASRREKGCEKRDADAAIATPNCVLLGALPSPFGSAFSTATATPGSSSDAACRVTTRRQSRLSAAAAKAVAVDDAAAPSLAPATAAASLGPQPAIAPPQHPPLLTDSLFAPLAAGIELRTRSSLSFEDKVKKGGNRGAKEVGVGCSAGRNYFFCLTFPAFFSFPLPPLPPHTHTTKNRSPPPPPRSSTPRPRSSTLRPSRSRAPSTSSA